MGSGPWWVAWAVYGPMAIVGAGWAYVSRGAVLSPAGEPWFGARYAGAVGLCLGAALALGTILATRVLVVHTRWARELHLTLRAALVGTSPRRVAQLALLSGISEELLFRSALAPSLGIVASSLLFGLMHIAPRGIYLAWALWASVMGMAFAVLFEASGTLLAPILAHVLINYENMQYIIHYDPTPLDSDRLG